MTRANITKARKGKKKDDNGVASYFWWKFRHGGKRYSKTRPRASQLTQSDKKSRVYAAAEEIEDAQDPEQMENALENAKSEIEEVAQEYMDSAESIREHFSESETADLCEQNSEELDGVISELDSALQDIQALEDDSDEDTINAAMEQAQGVDVAVV